MSQTIGRRSFLSRALTLIGAAVLPPLPAAVAALSQEAPEVLPPDDFLHVEGTYLPIRHAFLDEEGLLLHCDGTPAGDEAIPAVGDDGPYYRWFVLTGGAPPELWRLDMHRLDGPLDEMWKDFGRWRWPVPPRWPSV